MAKQKARPARANAHAPHLWELPDVVLFQIVSFVAAPTRRAFVICHQLAPLCSASRQALLVDETQAGAIWDSVLKEDYGGISTDHHDPNSSSPLKRASKRLKKTLVQQVQSAHKLIIDNTEIAYFYISELCSGQSAGGLTKPKMCKIIDEYGPHLRINEVVSSGGLFLVELCRARNITESIVLRCVKELIEHYHARPDGRTDESNNSQLTALCVVAVRGMSKVVLYLLGKGASIHSRSSGRFRLHTQPGGNGRARKSPSLRCDNATPLEFASEMRDAETSAGAKSSDLKGLNRCIQQLKEAAVSDGQVTT